MKSDQHNYKIFDPKSGFSVTTKNSHSAAYALIAYQTAWLKIHYPLEFMTSLLSSEIQNNDKDIKLHSYIRQAQEMGFTIIRPDVNKSGMKYKIEKGIRSSKGHEGEEYDFIRTPLTTLKGVGNKAVAEIIEHAPYSTLDQFLHKVDGRKVTSKVFESLAVQHCLTDTFKAKPKEIMAEYEVSKARVKKEKDSMRKEKKQEEEYGGNIFDKMMGSEISF